MALQPCFFSQNQRFNYIMNQVLQKQSLAAQSWFRIVNITAE